jgi:amino acid transporter
MGGCFTLEWLKDLLIYLVWVIVIVSILRLVVPWIANFFGIPILAQILSIILWGVIAICGIIIIFALLSCLGGGGFPLFPHHG